MPMDTVRGRDVWHTVFNLRGGIPFYRVNDRYEAWFDIAHARLAPLLAGHRRGQLRAEAPLRDLPGAARVRREQRKSRQESVEHPLDEATFLYFIRTLPLRVGMDTSFNDYFKAKGNPVRLKVLRARHDRGAAPASSRRSSSSRSSSRSSSPRAATPRSGFRTTRIASCCR